MGSSASQANFDHLPWEGRLKSVEDRIHFEQLVLVAAAGRRLKLTVEGRGKWLRVRQG